MALLLARTSQLIRNQGNQKLSHVLKTSAENAIGPCTVLAANLTAYPGGTAPRYKPWPYAEKGFKAWHMAIDRVDWRMDDNSKIIVVDGNLATGKTALAQHIAKQFDLLYVPDVTDEDMYWWETGMKYDSREKDDELPFDARTCDFQTFYGSKTSTGAKARQRFPRTQYMLFRYKLLKYAQLVTAHILSTGQGVVMNRGMWSDLVWAQTLRKTGWMSAAAMKEYRFQFRNATDYFFHPHLSIYLDAPVDLVKENIKKRNTPWEVDSPVIDDNFIQAMSDAYKEHYLPHMRQHGEVLVYDLAEGELDLDLVVEDLENLDLDNPTDDYPKRFDDWNVHNRELNRIRRMVTPAKQVVEVESIFNFHPPFDAPELWLNGHDYYQYEEIVKNDPRCEDKRYSRDNPLMTALNVTDSHVLPCTQPLVKSR